MENQTSPGAILKVTQVASFMLVLDRSERAGAPAVAPAATERRRALCNGRVDRCGSPVLLSRSELLVATRIIFSLRHILRVAGDIHSRPSARGLVVNARTFNRWSPPIGLPALHSPDAPLAGRTMKIVMRHSEGLDRRCCRGGLNRGEAIPFGRGPGTAERSSGCVADIESSSGLPLSGQTREADLRLAGLCVTKPPLALRGE
ncbi:hypothetical protein ABIA06_005441 [Bradyrhizobium yuanmingense]